MGLRTYLIEVEGIDGEGVGCVGTVGGVGGACSHRREPRQIVPERIHPLDGPATPAAAATSTTTTSPFVFFLTNWFFLTGSLHFNIIQFIFTKIAVE